MKIEECKVGMRVVVLDGRNTHSNMRWMPNMDCMVGREFAVEEIRPGGAKIAGWYMAYEWLSPAPNEQEEKIADSSASLDDVMDRLAGKAAELVGLEEVSQMPHEILERVAAFFREQHLGALRNGIVDASMYGNGYYYLGNDGLREISFSEVQNPHSWSDPNTAMLARDEVPEETKQVLTREPKEIPWYSRIAPMSERVEV